MIIDPNLNDYPDSAGVGYGNQDPAGLVGLAGHWSFGTGLGSGRPATIYTCIPIKNTINFFLKKKTQNRHVL